MGFEILSEIFVHKRICSALSIGQCKVALQFSIWLCVQVLVCILVNLLVFWVRKWKMDIVN